jgi:hypothetical protein
VSVAHGTSGGGGPAQVALVLARDQEIEMAGRHGAPFFFKVTIKIL